MSNVASMTSTNRHSRTKSRRPGYPGASGNVATSVTSELQPSGVASMPHHRFLISKPGSSSGSRHAQTTDSTPRRSWFGGSGSKHGPSIPHSNASAPSTSVSLKRKKSSRSTSPTHVVTARVEGEERIGPSTPSRSSTVYYDCEPLDHNKRDNEKAADKIGSVVLDSSRTSRRYFAEDGRESPRDKYIDRPKVYSGPLAHAEFERMKKEIEQLKKAAHDAKKAAKKQAKEIKELKGRLQTEILAKDTRNLELQVLKDKSEKNEELVTMIENSLQCQICMDLLHKPYALSPCGHILCLLCLQQWFRKAPSSADDSDMDTENLQDDPHYILTRTKTCPCCRAVVKHRPVPVFLVKSVVTTLAKSKHGEEKPPGRDPSPDGDPWKGLFRLTDDEREGYDDDEAEADTSDSEEDYGFGYQGAVRWTLDDLRAGFRGPFGFEYESSSPSVSDFGEEDEDDAEDDPDEDDADGVHGGMYVQPRWEPPTVAIESGDYDCFGEEEREGILNMLRRGCTYEMIRTYRMEYTHNQGLVAWLRSLDELYAEPDDGYFLGGRGEGSNYHRVFLGWNIKLDEADTGGDMYMQVVLNEVKENARGWECVERFGEEGVYDVRKRVGVDEVEEYETTDTEVWLDTSDHYEF